MPQQYLDSVEFINEAYETNFGPVLAAYMPPKCPSTYDGVPQVYDLNQKTCTVSKNHHFSTSTHNRNNRVMMCRK